MDLLSIWKSIRHLSASHPNLPVWSTRSLGSNFKIGNGKSRERRIKVDEREADKLT